MMSLAAVLDTNVFMSAFMKPSGPPGQIIEKFLEHHAFELIVSKPIMNELYTAMAYARVQKYLSLTQEQIQLTILSIELLSNSVEGKSSIDVPISDPDDKKYLIAAIEGKADYLVTGDHHLLDLQTYDHIQIVKPRTFLTLLK